MAWRRRIRNPLLSHFLGLRTDHVHGHRTPEQVVRGLVVLRSLARVPFIRLRPRSAYPPLAR